MLAFGIEDKGWHCTDPRISRNILQAEMALRLQILDAAVQGTTAARQSLALDTVLGASNEYDQSKPYLLVVYINLQRNQ